MMELLKTIDKIHYYNVTFEVCRMCNMQSAHCLRGDAENIKIKKAYIDRFLQTAASINCLTITGGEPTLAVDMIQYIYDKCIEYGVEVYNVWCTTNGKIKSRKFLNVMTRFIEYTQEFDGELSGVSLSTDQFHDALPEENYWFYTDYEYYEDSKTRGKLNFTIPEGRAYDNNLVTNNWNGHQREDDKFVGYLNNSGELRLEEGLVYINAKGDILFCCDLSFYTQEYARHGNIMEGKEALFKLILENIDLEECECA